MKNTNNCTDPRSLVLDRMIQAEKESFPPSPTGEGQLIDFIMENADLALTAEQIRFLLWHSSPPFDPDREDYFAVLERMVTEAKNLGDTELVKHICAQIPFYPEDKDYERKMDFVQSAVRYFLSLGLNQSAGELCMGLIQPYVSIEERIAFCEQALKYLDNSFGEYACALAMRKMLRYIAEHGNEDCLHYCAFGETVLAKGDSIFLSPVSSFFAFWENAEQLYWAPAVLKGHIESIPPCACEIGDKVITDEFLAVGASGQYEEYAFVRHPDEKVICRADGKEYICHVFSYGRTERSGEQSLGDESEKNFFAPGIGPVRTILSVDSKEYVYELCDYTVKGGDGLLPLCVGNKWSYRQVGCPEYVDQIIEREIVSQNGGEYLLAGWDYSARLRACSE